MSLAAAVADKFFEVLYWVILVRVLLSWLPHNREHPLLKILYEGTEPILAPFRRLMPRGGLPLDLSPFLALLVLRVIHSVVVNALR